MNRHVPAYNMSHTYIVHPTCHNGIIPNSRPYFSIQNIMIIRTNSFHSAHSSCGSVYPISIWCILYDWFVSFYSQSTHSVVYNIVFSFLIANIMVFVYLFLFCFLMLLYVCVYVYVLGILVSYHLCLYWFSVCECT